MACLVWCSTIVHKEASGGLIEVDVGVTTAEGKGESEVRGAGSASESEARPQTMSGEARIVGASCARSMTETLLRRPEAQGEKLGRERMWCRMRALSVADVARASADWLARARARRTCGGVWLGLVAG